MSWSADYKVHQQFAACSARLYSGFCDCVSQSLFKNVPNWRSEFENLNWTTRVGGGGWHQQKYITTCGFMWRAHLHVWKMGQWKKKCRVSTAILWMKKFVAHLYKLLHFVSLDLYFIFLADVHAVRLLQEQPFICDVWFGFRVLRRTPNTLRMCVSSVTHVWT